MTRISTNQSDRCSNFISPLLDWENLEHLDDREALQRRIDRVARWFHTMRFPNGATTRGEYDPAHKLHRIKLPADLTGQSVLDVGAWDGFYSFECERRGSSRVVSVDLWDPNHNATSEGYAVAHKANHSTAVPIRSSVHQLDPDIHGTHDLVLCLGVLYHLSDPLDALRKLRSVCGNTLILETASDFAFTRRAALAYYPGKSFGSDPSNSLAPNVRALRTMCLDAGFSSVSLAYAMPLHMRAARSLYRARRFGESIIPGLSRGRIVVHARV